MITETNIDYSKLKQLDKFAKSLGITIYDIIYKENNNKYTCSIHDLNVSAERIKKYPALKGLAEYF
ncbi:MAG: hypothetical protein K6A44_01645 [bacterium]|nr:hypothetical protein [bacterium]